ncbi:corticoliberin [Denticeps clupeoides]|uniref:Corticotropin-releasing factor domain-containing protein n=1 Tax=Denticeps clupeoides TaxID=299321 RepID=A0AAY4AP34_9TELE|nr:corticoliberin-like [Denticeps clupeoides]
MKPNLLLWAVAALATFLPRCGSRALAESRVPPPPPPPPPVLVRLGEEYLIRLDQPGPASNPGPAVNRALQLRLTQRLLARERRSDEPPISLDLTFHLLREVLEMARAEQLAQQASSNRKMMDIFGK